MRKRLLEALEIADIKLAITPGPLATPTVKISHSISVLAVGYRFLIRFT